MYDVLLGFGKTCGINTTQCILLILLAEIMKLDQSATVLLGLVLWVYSAHAVEEEEEEEQMMISNSQDRISYTFRARVGIHNCQNNLCDTRHYCLITIR